MLPIHAAVMYTGEVLFWAPDLERHPEHSTTSAAAWPHLNDMTRVEVALFNPAGDEIRYPPMSNSRNLFCAGQCFLPDGRVFVAGGHAHPFNNPDRADRDIHTFDPGTFAWSRKRDMDVARWYPTCTALDDGRILIVSGYSDGVPPNPFTDSIVGLDFSTNSGVAFAPINAQYDLFNPTTEQLAVDSDRFWLKGYLPPIGEQALYPFVKLLPGGTLFAHNDRASTLFVPGGKSPLWRTRSPEIYTNVNTDVTRTYPGQGACVVLPLDNSPRCRILVVGGSEALPATIDYTNSATDTAEIFEFDATRPHTERQAGWRSTSKMNNRRFMSDAVLLPNGSVLILGGSAMGKADDNSQPVLQPEMFDPETESFTPMAMQSVPRQYHSVAVLLPSGRILSAGSSGSWPHAPAPLDLRHPDTVPQYKVEIFDPPYLLTGDPRPEIYVAPDSITYGATATLTLESDLPITSVMLMRPCAVTHSNDMEQRAMRLEFEMNSSSLLDFDTPQRATWMPPGWYMLFVVNSRGVPSRGHFLHLS